MDHSMELTREQVLRREIPWEAYVTAKLVTPTTLQLIRRYDHKPENVQAALLEENGPVYVGAFVALLRNIAKDETVEYILALIDEILSVNPRHARLFHDRSLVHEDIYGPFLRLLPKRNWFVQEKSCKILALIISSFPKNGESVGSPNGSIQSCSNLPDNVLHDLVHWLYGQLRRPSHPTRGIPIAISSLATLLRVPNFRSMFIHADGVKLIAPLLSATTSQQHIQLLYETALCIWLLSFHDPATDQLAGAGVVPRLMEVAKTCTKEKVVRMAILALKNLLPKGTFASDMVEAGLSKIIKTLKLQNWSDEDLVEALDSLEASLDDNIRILSSFEKYKQEVISGALDWTPMHKNPVFWMENASKFEQNDFQVLRMLITILDNSRDPKTKAIACHDLAHFIQSHPAGRGIVLDLRAKDRVMRLMDHENEEVRKEALLCVQKLLLSAKYAGCI